MKALARLLALISATALVQGLGQAPIVSFNGSSSDFQLAGGRVGAGQIMVSENDYWGVIRAAGDLAMDFGRVTGTNYTLSTDARLNSSSGAAAVYSYQPVNNKNNTFVRVPVPSKLDPQDSHIRSSQPPQLNPSPARATAPRTPPPW